MRVIYLIAAIIMVMSCSTKRVNDKSREIIVKDSIVYVEKITHTPAVHDTVVIDSPCDSITGKLRPFTATLNSGRGKVMLSNNKGNIEAKISLDELSDKVIKEDRYSNYSSNVKESEKKVKYRSNWKLIGILILSIMLNIYLIFIKKG